MTEIEKLIEKACANYCEKVDSVYNEKDVFKAGASFILHQNRWRKVEEELPEEDRYSTSLPVFVKTKYGTYNVAYYSYKYNDFVNGNTSIYSVTEWKPIE